MAARPIAGKSVGGALASIRGLWSSGEPYTGVVQAAGAPAPARMCAGCIAHLYHLLA
jgi:hypothetical protein